jgi:hypothetical protein
VYKPFEVGEIIAAKDYRGVYILEILDQKIDRTSYQILCVPAGDSNKTSIGQVCTANTNSLYGATIHKFEFKHVI